MNRMKSVKSKISDHKGRVVLLYSGDQEFLKYYRSMFLSLGLTPVTARTPEAALGFLRLMVVAFVVVDQNQGIPRCGQVIRHARAMPYHASVIVISRKQDRDFRDTTTDLGATKYLNHPALQDDMLHALLPKRAYAQRSGF